MALSFTKMHGLGNDFVILDGRSQDIKPTRDFLAALADRKRGIGYDQLIVLRAPKSPSADIYMDMFNADGSTVRACGNATRCVARLLFDENGKSSGTIETVAGLLAVRQISPDIIAVDFGAPKLEWQDIPLAQACDTLHLPLAAENVSDPCAVNMGNPHAVFFVKNIDEVSVAERGSWFEHHELFPDRCNIEFAQILSPDRIHMRVWERGTGITEACGTGACATLVAAVRRGLSERKVDIILDGGIATVEWREADGHVILAGPAALAYKGMLDDDLFTHARKAS
jgi:diaminopimelate epimerase